MSNFLIALIVSVVVVAIFVIGLSITLMRKGHNIETDVGSNRHMRALGLECASAQIRREEAARLGLKDQPLGCGESQCDSCSTDTTCAPKLSDSDKERC